MLENWNAVLHIMFVATLCLIGGQTVCAAEYHQKAPPKYPALSAEETKLTGGILYDRCQKNIDNLWLKIDVETLKQVYREEHDSWYAEPEFCGHYLKSGVEVYRTTGNPTVLDRLRQLVETIIESQCEDGYLGTYKPGKEFDSTFSIWNCQFTMMGLMAYYQLTGYQAGSLAPGKDEFRLWLPVAE